MGSEHDQLVREEVLLLLSEGYRVQARLDGWFDLPDTIFGYRPDIVAEKEGETLIIEVKKGEEDWPKIVALQHFEKVNPKCKFKVINP